MSLLLYTDPRFLLHETGKHPENPRRLETIAAHLEEVKLLERVQQAECRPATRQELERAHAGDHVSAVEEYAKSGGGRIETDTVVSPQSFEVAQLAAGSACDAVDRVLKGDVNQALCLIRPPGHHALPDGAMGFCLFNNVAVAAMAALEAHGLSRVLIVDWDVHHGNGTQDRFYEDSRVGFFSAHRWPFYPGTGEAAETGAGDGLGSTKNLPLEYGTPRDRYLGIFRRELEDFADRIKPELVLISAGFDAHRQDPIGSLGLEEEDFDSLTRMVQNIAATHAEGRIVSLLEGGYHPLMLAESVAAHMEALLDA